VDGPLFKRALLGSLSWLSANHEEANRLNVFPVPDGDTGTNMLLTLQSAVEDIKESNAAEVSKIAKLASHGSLMGARGNSGVILSQIFRGFARAVEGKSELSPRELAAAFEEAANAAYRAVNKPTEGTILTVAREAGRAASAAASDADASVPGVAFAVNGGGGPEPLTTRAITNSLNRITAPSTAPDGASSFSMDATGRSSASSRPTGWTCSPCSPWTRRTAPCT